MNFKIIKIIRISLNIRINIIIIMNRINNQNFKNYNNSNNLNYLNMFIN
jgi:hypothetical protein